MKRITQKLLLLTLIFTLFFNLAGCQPAVEKDSLNPVQEDSFDNANDSVEEDSPELVEDNIKENPLNLAQEAVIRENVKEWFGGEEVNKYVGSNRDYDWYIDQGNTGEYSHSNCGPSSTVMAMKWLDKDFEETAEEAREEHFISGGWWYTSIITKYFDDRDVKYTFLKLEAEDKEKSIDDLKNIINEEKIALLCINMDYITRENDTNLHINRFYDYDDGHFLIVKGYAEVDGTTYFEVYDPNNWGNTYTDGSLMGKDRYYHGEELITSAVNWYEFGIIIEPKVAE